VIAEIGHYALVLALVLALVQAVVPMIGARIGDATLMNVAGATAGAQFAFVAASFAALTWCYVASDFSVINVYENSHSLMPLISAADQLPSPLPWQNSQSPAEVLAVQALVGLPLFWSIW